jgi:hypothetical protein
MAFKTCNEPRFPERLKDILLFLIQITSKKRQSNCQVSWGHQDHWAGPARPVTTAQLEQAVKWVLQERQAVQEKKGQQAQPEQ